MSAGKRQRPGPTVLLPASILIAVSLLGLLVYYGDIDVRQVGDIIAGVSGVEALFIGIGGLIHMSTSAVKWQMVITRVSDKADRKEPFSFYLYYTTLGALFGQVVPVHVSTMVVRGAALKIHTQASAIKGALSSGYEQAFDVLIPLVLVGPTILVLTLDLGVVDWVCTSAVCLIGGGLVVPAIGTVAPSLSHIFSSFQTRLPGRLSDRIGRFLDSNLLDYRTLRALYWLSAIRFAGMLIRTLVVAMAFGPSISMANVVIAMPLVLASNLIAITPGGLGVAEWGWTALLVLQGHTLGDAGAFAIANRIALVFSLLLVLLPAAATYLWQKPKTALGAPRN